jgi:hypothetical protein
VGAMARLVILAIALAFPLFGIGVAACGEEDPPIRSVNTGMSMSQVRELMGEPDGVERKADGLECWTWGAAPLAEAAPHGSHGTPPPAKPKGCHGFETVLFKQLTSDPAQGPEIVLQTQSELGRGGTLQAFLASVCGLGSQA